MKEHKVLIIDDDEELACLLKELLVQQGYNADLAHDGQTGLNQARTQEYDVILLDVMLPVLDGFEVLKQLRTTHFTPVIMLTARGDDFDRIFGLELGADDYLPKPFNHRELLARVKAITRRVEHFAHAKTTQLELNNVLLHVSAREVSCAGQPITLTGTEFQILHLLMQNPGEIVSKQTISETVLNRRLAAFDRSIDMHVSNIRKKLQAKDSNEKISTVRSAGYIFLQR